MTHSHQQSASTEDIPQSDEKGWSALCRDIRALAVRKASRMLGEPDIDGAAFDREARELRMLMGSAEIAARMKRQDEKDQRLNDEQRGPRAHTDEELNEVFRRVSERVDRLEREEREAEGILCAHPPGDDRRHARQGGGKDLGDACA